MQKTLKGFVGRHWPFYVGLIVVLFFVLSPYVKSFLVTPPGQVWMPFNHHSRACGDFRFYYSGVREAQEDFFHFHHPSSSDDSMLFFDKSRVGLYRLSAVLSLFVADGRVGFLLSYVLSVVLTFFLIYSLVLRISDDALGATLVGIAFLFFPLVIRTLFFSGLEDSLYHLVRIFKPDSRIVSFDTLNDHFRYLVMALANVVLVLILHFSLWPQNMFRRRIFFLLAIPFLFVWLYSYTPLVLLGGPILLLSQFYQLKFYRRLDFVYLFSIVGAILIALVLQVPQDLIQIYTSLPRLIVESHVSSIQTSLSDQWTQLFPILKMALFLLILRSINYRLGSIDKPKQFLLNISTGIFILFWLAGFLNKPEVFVRLFVRGGFSLIYLLILIDLFIFLKRVLGKRPYLIICSILLLFSTSLILSSERISKYGIETKAYQIEENRWNLYQWLQAHIPSNTPVLALNYEDLQLIPTLTDLNLTIVTSEYGEAPEESLSKLAAGFKLLNYDFDFFHMLFQQYDAKFLDVPCGGLPPEKSALYWPVYLLNQVLYIPYIKTFNGSYIRSQEGNHFSSDFLKQLKSVWVRASDTMSSDWIIFDKSIYQRAVIPPNYTIASQFGTILVLKKNQP